MLEPDEWPSVTEMLPPKPPGPDAVELAELTSLMKDGIPGADLAAFDAAQDMVMKWRGKFGVLESRREDEADADPVDQA